MTAQPSPLIDTVDVIDVDLAGDARRLLARCVPTALRDDRFDLWPGGPATATPGATVDPAEGVTGDPSARVSPLPLTAAVARLDGELVGLLTAPVGDDRADLDLLVDPAVHDQADTAHRLVVAALAALGEAGPATVQLWARPRHRWHHDLARRLDARPTRVLHQMRAPLPVTVEPLASRAYRAHDDLEALRSVNNRAFATHPDQGGRTAEQLLGPMAEPWFRPEGVRLHEIDGRLAGFCWTKIHAERPNDDGPATPALGEIYVIGVDPDFHGRGLGVPMTAAGLVWLTEQGLTTAMLYVEADNAPALRTYERLGFEIVRSDAAWLLPRRSRTGADR
ncbi:MAG: mycothiol synthase [Actinomycetota bacterium]